MPRFTPVSATRWAPPITRDEAATARRSERARREYQNVRPSATVCGASRPGLTTRARPAMPRMIRTTRTVTGTATLECDALVAAVSGLGVPSAEWGSTVPDPVVAVLGCAVAPDRGTRDETGGGTVVPGPPPLPAATSGSSVVPPCDDVVGGVDPVPPAVPPVPAWSPALDPRVLDFLDLDAPLFDALVTTLAWGWV